LPETNIGLMPAWSVLQTGRGLEEAPVGQKFSQFLADKGVIIVVGIWQAGGVASRSNPIVNPEDAKGLKVRGGSRNGHGTQGGGASTLSLPSNGFMQPCRLARAMRPSPPPQV
jgi:hypothetical protein